MYIIRHPKNILTEKITLR